MPRRKKKPTAKLPVVAPIGPPQNVRPAGPMADRRLRRRKTRQAEEDAAINEDGSRESE